MKPVPLVTLQRDSGGGLVLVTWGHLAFACRESWWRMQDGDQAKRLGITLVLVGQVAVDVGRDLVS